MIPYKSINIKDLNSFAEGTLSDHLKMEVVDLGEDFIVMEMPVESYTKQPMGLLHGGAVASIAENAGSLGSYLIAGRDKIAAGMTLNCNHLKSVKDGKIRATAKAIHIGKNSHVWEIEVRNEQGELTNVCRLTVAIRDKK
ncbi:hotdog fold thioesterase [bacterium]|nr:hotdog fold thioesterase [bacterium]